MSVGQSLARSLCPAVTLAFTLSHSLRMILSGRVRWIYWSHAFVAVLRGHSHIT